MSYPEYSEPEVTFAILDFCREVEATFCLKTIKDLVKIPYRIVYLHNGPSEYAYNFYLNGLIDIFLQTRNNNGLGVGTRDLMSVVHTKYTIYLQPDQLLSREFFSEELPYLKDLLDHPDVGSVSLAGVVTGPDKYSERCHIIKTEFYRKLERELPLSNYGAGPYSAGMWREEQIQNYYRDNGLKHITSHLPLVRDIGKYSIRDTAGGQAKMRTDTKAVWWLKPPTEKYVWPHHSDEEWEIAKAGKWPDGKIPQYYLDNKMSFRCWDNLNL